ncbi:MAG: HD domain-containing protein [Patescibacteria group bacterium]|jgi:tRNA nucleotidyltransferase/poly(A) polymerase
MPLTTLPKKLLRHTAVRILIQLAVEQGTHVYLVGGAVRDLLRGKALADIDVVVTGISYKKLGAFLSKHGTVNAVGDFGTIKFLANGEHSPIDIALPRTERSAEPGSRTGFRVRFDETLPIEEDLGRRDFTINAMALDLISKKLIDPFEGQKDIAERIIQTVGDPTERFSEDYTRMLRAIRFTCELDATIATDTRKALKTLSLKLSERVIPKEMIAQELTKALVAHPSLLLELLNETGIGKILFPELMALHEIKEAYDGDAWSHTHLALEATRDKKYCKIFGGPEKDPTVLWAILLHDIGKKKTRQARKVGGKTIVTFHRHAERSADLAQVIWERLQLAQGGARRTPMLAAIAHHMVLSRGALSTITDQTLDAYFLAQPEQGKVLKRLLLANWEAGDPKKRAIHRKEFMTLEERLQNIERRAYKKGKPLFLISGKEIMRDFGMQPGEQLGVLLAELRAKQLNGELTTPGDARAFVKEKGTHHAKH